MKPKLLLALLQTPIEVALWIFGIALLRYGPIDLIRAATPVISTKAQSIAVTQPTQTQVASKLSAEEVEAKVAPSTVAIVSDSGAVGTGCIWSADGLIVTNRHVAEGVGDGFQVELHDGQKLPGTTIAIDDGEEMADDLALIKIEAVAPLTPIVSSPSAPVDGALLYTIGFPDYPQRTFTATTYQGLWADGRLKTGEDAVRPGNSGGPLLNDRGEMVGVNSTYSKGRGMGGSIPIGVVREFVDSVVSNSGD